AFQKKCLGKMQDAASEGRTVIFVSHNMTAVKELCSRALLLHGGRVIADADAGTVVHEYLNDREKAEKQQGEVSLSDWENRYGEGTARIVRARLIDGAGQPTTSFVRSHPLVLEFQVVSQSRARLNFSAVCACNGTGVFHITHHDSPGCDPGVIDG